MRLYLALSAWAASCACLVLYGVRVDMGGFGYTAVALPIVESPAVAVVCLLALDA